jgi:nanoRNase/pAp phosphatase (c-di-AMP/oligoRNAs hydrolase)
MKEKKRKKGILQRHISNRERLDNLREIFHKTDNLLILIVPDPDSIASALALKRLLWKFVHNITIAYTGRIERLENRAMIQLLKIKMVDMVNVDPGEFSKKALVDSQPYHSDILSCHDYDVIIDHHPLIKELHAPYIDIRPDYGATATIMIEYLKVAGIRPSERLATALLYAIKVDTQNFERNHSEIDIKGFHFAFRYANQNLLRKIESSEMELKDLDYYKKALNMMTVSKKRIFAHLGKVDRPDICVQVADFFHRINGISWIFVSGIYMKNLIIIIRNDGVRKDAGKLAEMAFGHLGKAGGHKGAARAELPMDKVILGKREEENRIIKAFLKERIDQAMRKNRG